LQHGPLVNAGNFPLLSLQNDNDISQNR